MKLSTLEFLPDKTRVLLLDEFRKRILSDKEGIMKKLGVSRNTINTWIRGEYRPSIKQLKMLGVTLSKSQNEIKELGLEGGKVIRLSKEMPTTELSWIVGILDGDNTGKRDGIGISNQDINLVKTFIDITSKLFGCNREDFKVYVTWYTNEPLSEIAKFLEINEKQIRYYKPSKTSYKINSPQVQAVFYSRTIKKFLENIKNTFSINSIQFAWYVRGLADSDGGFARNNITISQKYNKIKNLEIVKKILDSFEIQNGGIKGPDSKNMLRINIFSDKQNLKKYNNFIGFYSKPKLEKLNSLIT